MPTRKCLGTNKTTFQSILGVSISVRKYRQKIKKGGDPPPTVGQMGGLGQINYTILYYTANHLLLLLLFLLLPYSSSTSSSPISSSTSSSSSTAVHCTSPLQASMSHQIRRKVVFVR